MIANPGPSEALLDDQPSVTFVATPAIRDFFDEVAILEGSSTVHPEH